MSRLIQIIGFLIIASITVLDGLSQDRAAQIAKPTAKESFLFQNLVAAKSINIETFKLDLPLQLGSINARTLNLRHNVASKQSAENDSFPSPDLARPVVNRLGNIELFKTKTDMHLGFEQNRALNLSSSDFRSSRKKNLLDVK